MSGPVFTILGLSLVDSVQVGFLCLPRERCFRGTLHLLIRRWLGAPPPPISVSSIIACFLIGSLAPILLRVLCDSWMAINSAVILNVLLIEKLSKTHNAQTADIRIRFHNDIRSNNGNKTGLTRMIERKLLIRSETKQAISIGKLLFENLMMASQLDKNAGCSVKRGQIDCFSELLLKP